jgi:hypothetical protein
VADDDLIAQYVASLNHALQGRMRHADRVCAEIDDHLRSTADGIRAAGLTEADATVRAIECFGPVDELASSFLSLERGGAGARATRFTTRAGLVGVIGGLFIALAAASQVAADTSHNESGARAVVGIALFATVILMVAVGFVGMIVRHRGTMRPIDRLGLAAVAVGVVVLWVPFWIWYFAFPLMVGGTVIFGVRVFRVHALPRPPLVFMLLAGALLLALTYFKSDKSSVEFGIGWVFVLAGWCWLQFTLWSERPERRTRHA